MMEAIILAGGLGTRLRSVIGEMPKPMAEVAGRPFLEYQLDYLVTQGVTRVVLAIGYQADVIKAHFGDRYKSMEVVYSVEEELLGTGGAIQQALSYCTAPQVFVLNGDSFFRLELSEMLKQHQGGGAPVSVAIKQMHDCSRYGTVELNDEDKVTAFFEKQELIDRYINTGLYCVDADLFEHQEYPKKFSFEKAYLELQATHGQLKAFKASGYFIDIGIPSDYAKAEEYFSSTEMV